MKTFSFYLQIPRRILSPSQYTFQVFKRLIVGEGFNYFPEMNLRHVNLFAIPGHIQQVCLPRKQGTKARSSTSKTLCC